jgi:hypothetical protein
MTALESGMASVRGNVTDVEQFVPGQRWPVEAKWRVMLDDHKWIYCDSVAFAGGLGMPRKLAPISQNPQFEKALIAAKRLTYAQEALIPPVPAGGTILVIGGSGTAGWAAQEAVRTGCKAIIVTLDAGLAGVPPHVRRDLTAHGVEVVQGEVVSAALEDGRVVLGVGSRDDPSPRLIMGDGVSIAVGQVPTLPKGVEQLHFRMVKRTVNGKERVVALEAFDPITNAPSGVRVQGAAMTTRPFKVGPTPVVEDRAAFARALEQQANDPAVPDDSRGVEPSIHQSAINVPLSNEGSR